MTERINIRCSYCRHMTGAQEPQIRELRRNYTSGRSYGVGIGFSSMGLREASESERCLSVRCGGCKRLVKVRA